MRLRGKQIHVAQEARAVESGHPGLSLPCHWLALKKSLLFPEAQLGLLKSDKFGPDDLERLLTNLAWDPCFQGRPPSYR